MPPSRPVTPPIPRSWLFVPADDPRRIEKALRCGAGAVIADIEDAVAPQRKPQAREAAVAFAAVRDRSADGPEPLRVVRVNDPAGAPGRADLQRLSGIEGAVAMVPKARLSTVAIALEATERVVALVETAAGVLELERIAATSGVLAVALGSVDLGAELGLRELPGDEQLLHVRSRLAIACAAAEVAAIDGVFLDVADERGLEAQAQRSMALGLDGKLCVHPRQVDAIERAFAPQAEEIEQARRTIEIYQQALRRGRGAALDGAEMVDLATVRRAERVLADAGHAPEHLRTPTVEIMEE